MMSPLRLLPALVLALLVLSSCCSSSAARSDIAGEQVSFGSGYSQYTLTSAETAFFNHTVADSGSYGVLTHFWITGGASALIDTSVWSYYIDGESSPSIQFTPAMAAGVGFADPTAPWGNRWMGKGAADGGWYNNFPVPFQKSIRITGRVATAGQSAGLYVIFRGTENLPITMSGLTLPYSARLVQQRITDREYQPLDFVTVLDVPSGSGVLFAHTLSVSSGNLNFLEGCYHAYTPHDAPFPGITVSTGTEDYYDSAYYFNAGQFRQSNAGLTHIAVNDSAAELSAYRLHENDGIFFTRGFRFVWRNGDVSDPATGFKCTLDTGGDPAGSPTKSRVSTYTWAYVWPQQDRVSSD